MINYPCDEQYQGGETAVFQDMTALRKRVFEIIEVGSPEDRPSRIYDFINMLAIVVNLTISILYTF